MEHRGLTAGAAPVEPPQRSQRRVYAVRLCGFAVMWLVVAFPTAMIHLNAIGLVDTSGSAPLSARHVIAAAAANPMGPWAGHAVRVVGSPNAGLRGVDRTTALGLSVLFGMLVGIGVATDHRVIRWIALLLFALLLPVWNGYGFFLIADGML